MKDGVGGQPRAVGLRPNCTSGSLGEMVQIQVPKPSFGAQIPEGGVGLGCLILKPALQAQHLKQHSKIRSRALRALRWTVAL